MTEQKQQHLQRMLNEKPGLKCSLLGIFRERTYLC